MSTPLLNTAGMGDTWMVMTDNLQPKWVHDNDVLDLEYDTGTIHYGVFARGTPWGMVHAIKYTPNTHRHYEHAWELPDDTWHYHTGSSSCPCNLSDVVEYIRTIGQTNTNHPEARHVQWDMVDSYKVVVPAAMSVKPVVAPVHPSTPPLQPPQTLNQVTKAPAPRHIPIVAVAGWFPNIGQPPAKPQEVVEIETAGGNLYTNRADAFIWAIRGAAIDIRRWRYIDTDAGGKEDSKIMSPKKKVKLPEVPLPVYDNRPLPSGDEIMDIVDQMSKGRGYGK